VPGDTLPCQQLGPNNRFGGILPEGVWIFLRVLGYDLGQWCNLQEFYGDVHESWWEGNT